MQEEEILRRSFLRRQKLMEKNEERMRKIMSGTARSNLDVSQSNSIDKITPSKSDFKQDSPQDGFSSESPSLPLDETDKKEENCMIRNRVSKENILKYDESISRDDLFPKKVSLISSPLDFKTNKNLSSNQNSFPFYIYTFITFLANECDTLLPSFTLLVIAAIGSINDFNFFIPFIISQLIRGAYFYCKNPSSCVNCLLWIRPLFHHLSIFIALYIFIHALKIK